MILKEVKGMRLGKYEVGRTLGEGNFGKVKYARDVETGSGFAVKILEKSRIINLKVTDQIKREIATLKLLKHPNVVRLHEVLASKTKIYMILEHVTGGELFDKIATKGKLPESEGRKLFQQLIDGVSYCHNRGVYHRDLKLENVLVDSRGSIKITDFGLSALPQHYRVNYSIPFFFSSTWVSLSFLKRGCILFFMFDVKFQEDGLLHTTCGSPNYVAPEVLSNRGYHGATSDVWSCGVILYVILMGYLPFDDRNLAVLYQKIFKGDFQIPKLLSPGAKGLIRRILDPSPVTRITIDGIKADDWFRVDYEPVIPEDEEEASCIDEKTLCIDDKALSMNEMTAEGNRSPGSPSLINAFELIGMSSYFDLSGFFEKEVVSDRKIRFTSNHSAKDLLKKIEDIVMEMGFRALKKNGRLKVTQERKGDKSPGSLTVSAEVFEISQSLYVVELRKSSGDSSTYRQLCMRLSNELGVPQATGGLMASES
ncbi:hypothetical protein SAY86_028876 [Trapa natans]|uniref:non-specific serine/threonine protein kinase n=1 Tax=Trapa natans TaxID=22666 RepID=A0AAN7RCL9_TRANT|nr:hypothetical protein SAY86_028876 [Trapa natans]